VTYETVRWFNTLSFFRSEGDGTFTKPLEDVNVQKGVNDIATGDLNGDTFPDIVMANLGYGNVSVLLSNGAGDFIRNRPTGLDTDELRSLDPTVLP